MWQALYSGTDKQTENAVAQISWFFAPTVSLCEQQHRVISEALPVSVGLITGAKHPDQWKDTNMWQTVLRDYRVVVSTPQVLLDALRHGYIVMGRDLSLLIFDEAHHAVEGDPYNRIMQEFYRSLPPRIRGPDGFIPDFVRPMIMGLTASPIYGGNVDRAFKYALYLFISPPRFTAENTLASFSRISIAPSSHPASTEMN